MMLNCFAPAEHLKTNSTFTSTDILPLWGSDRNYIGQLLAVITSSSSSRVFSPGETVGGATGDGRIKFRLSSFE